jgi:hypothetical protein
MILNRNGHYTLAGFILFGIVATLSQRISLEAFAPYVPVSVAMSLLVTVHVIPWIKTFFHQRITLGDYVAANHEDHPSGTYRAMVDPYSVQSIRDVYDYPDHGWSLEPLELQHMHLNGEDQITARPGSPALSSSLDLETGMYLQTQLATAGLRDPLLS